VLEEFRLHFTLTSATTEANGLAPALATFFETAVRDPNFRVDALVAFMQNAGRDFRVLRRYPLGDVAAA